VSRAFDSHPVGASAQRTLRFSRSYACLFLGLLGVEVVIALFVHDQFVRPYVGDSLAVILLYCLIRTFFGWPQLRVLGGALLFACCLELGQYFQLVSRLGLQDNVPLRVILGTVWSPLDLVAYAAGAAAAYAIERAVARRQRT
jgi:hypothetical protein